MIGHENMNESVQRTAIINERHRVTRGFLTAVVSVKAIEVVVVYGSKVLCEGDSDENRVCGVCERPGTQSSPLASYSAA
jgi:hypothetical protein